MAFDPSVISAIPDYAPKPAEAYAKGLTIKDMMDRSQLSSLELAGKKKDAAQSAQVEGILKESDYSTPQGLAKTAERVNRVSPKAAMDLLKTGQAYQSGQIQNEIDQLSLADQRQGLIVGAIDPIVAEARTMKSSGASDLEIRAYITQQMPGAIQQLRSMQLPDGKPALPDDQLKMVTAVPGGYTLATLEGWESRSKQGQAAIRQRFEQMKADTAERRANTEEDRLAEAERHNRQTEDTARSKVEQGGFTDIQRDLLAEMAVRNVNLPAGLRSQAQIKATLDGLVKNHPDKSAAQIADEIRSGKLKLTAEGKAAQTAGTQIGRVALAANELDTFGDRVLTASQGVPRGKFVPWNRLKQMGEKSISDPALLRFKTMMTALNNAYEQLAARGGTDADKRAHIHELFDTANSPEAVEALIRAVKEEAEGAREAANRTIDETSAASIPGAEGGAPPASPPAATPKAAGSPPAVPKTVAAGGNLAPGQAYRHASGATVQILPEGQ